MDKMNIADLSSHLSSKSVQLYVAPADLKESNPDTGTILGWMSECIYSHVFKKLCKIIFVRTLSNFHQLKIVGQKEGKEDKLMWGALIFHLT